FQTWRSLCWPMIRPAALKAAALVFLFAVVEPGAPLILGLRRTLAYQIVETAARTDPFPRVAVWSVMAGLYGWAGWFLLRWRAGPAGRHTQPIVAAAPRGGARAAAAQPFRSLAWALVLAAWLLFAWLPLVGLVRSASGAADSAGSSSGEGLGAARD